MPPARRIDLPLKGEGGVVKLRFREKSRFKSCGLLVKITRYSSKRKRFKRIY